MKFSKLMHLISIIVGFTGIFAFIGAMLGGAENAIFGITKLDTLACSAILILIAIWIQIATIHQMMLERKGDLL